MRPFSAVLAVVISVLGIAFGAPVWAQPGPAPLNDAVRREAVTTAARLLRQDYVFPEIGDQAALALESALANGSYDEFNDYRDFARRLTDDLMAVASDKHLRVTARAPGPASADDSQSRPRDEGGVLRADILGDNVGYIEILNFPATPGFSGPVSRAMSAVQDTRALIIDMRRNTGGNPRSVGLLVSYFLDGSEPVHINSIINRTSGTESFTTTEIWNQQTPVSYTGRPVYVLISNVTFSGGEAFSYHMQALDLAELVGGITGGGANPGQSAPLTAGLQMFVPRGRAQSPITGTNWEGVGVIPDIDVPREDALAVALQRLGVSPAPATIEEASVSRVFTPGPRRTDAQPGTAAAVRRLSDEVAGGALDYDSLTPDLAAVARSQMPEMQPLIAGLGAIDSISFVEVDRNGMDVYDVRYANGGMRWFIVLDDEGRAAMINAQPLLEQR